MDLDEIADALARELASLVEAAEAVLVELDAIEELRGGHDDIGEPMRSARMARRAAMAARSEAVEVTARSVDACERARVLGNACAARLHTARGLVR